MFKVEPFTRKLAELATREKLFNEKQIQALGGALKAYLDGPEFRQEILRLVAEDQQRSSQGFNPPLIL